MVARDDDEGSNAALWYTLQDNMDERFEIDAETGEVTSQGDFWPGNYTILTVSVQNGSILSEFCSSLCVFEEGTFVITAYSCIITL